MKWYRALLLFLISLFLGSSSYGQEQELEIFKRRLWVLEFRNQKPQRFQFDFSNYIVRKGYIGRKIKKAFTPSEIQNTEVYWYMVYTLTTYEKTPMSVFIDISAESSSKEAKRLPIDEEDKGLYPLRPKRVVEYHDRYYPLVQKALEMKYKRKFWGQDDLSLSRKEAPRNRNFPTKLNLPVLGDVDNKRPAILNFLDGNTLRGKITLLNAETVQMGEFKDEWNMIPFIRAILKNKDKITRAIITKTSDAGGEEIECTITDFARDEVIYKKFDEEGNVSLDQVQSIKVQISRDKVPSITYECVAIFKNWDRHMDHLKITVKGLTNGILYNVGQRNPPKWSRAGPLLNRTKAEQEAEDLEKEAKNEKNRGQKSIADNLEKLAQKYRQLGQNDRILRYSVYELFYDRPGDEFYTTLDKLIFVSKGWQTYVKMIKMDLPGKEGND